VAIPLPPAPLSLSLSFSYTQLAFRAHSKRPLRDLWTAASKREFHGTRTASADRKAWRTHLAATSTSITAPSALNPIFFHRRPRRCDPFRITALACTRSSCFRDRIINRTVPARANARAFLPRCLKAQRSRYFDPLSRFFSPAIIFIIWMRSSWNVEACGIAAISVTKSELLNAFLLRYKKMRSSPRRWDSHELFESLLPCCLCCRCYRKWFRSGKRTPKSRNDNSLFHVKYMKFSHPPFFAGRNVWREGNRRIETRKNVFHRYSTDNTRLLHDSTSLRVIPIH